MKSSGLQELINRLFNDVRAKEEFLKDPDAVVTRYNLSENEKNAVMNTYGKIGLATDSIQLEAEIGPLSYWT